jgi:tRNA(Glu) U13 pseudouridine synthase TruD
MWIKKIKLGKLSKVKTEMKLGDLSGNRFSIAIRFIEGSVSLINPFHRCNKRRNRTKH